MESHLNSAHLTAEKKKRKTLLTLELLVWDGRPHCMYLNSYRISGGKPYGGGESIQSWRVSQAQLQDILTSANARGMSSVALEVFKHTNNTYAVYLDNVLLEGPRPDSRNARPRRVGSTVVYLNREVSLHEFGRAVDALSLPTAG